MQDGRAEIDGKVCEMDSTVVQEMKKACPFQDHRNDDGDKYKNKL
jgi:hypothetical protein